VIATSTKVDVSKVNTDKINDAFFAKDEKDAKKSTEFFDKTEKKTELPSARKDAQKAVDSVLLATLKAGAPELKAYLGARFSLTKNTKPHQLKF